MGGILVGVNGLWCGVICFILCVDCFDFFVRFIFGENIMWFYFCIFVYCGGGILVLENILVGFCCGLEYGYCVVEFDVMFICDEVFILMYDLQCGCILFGVGKIVEIDWVELCDLEVGVWLDVCFVGECFCMLEQGLDFCLVEGIWMNVEIKFVVVEFVCCIGELIVQVVVWCFNGKSGVVLLVLFLFFFDVLLVVREVVFVLLCGYLVDVIFEDWQVCLEQLQVVVLYINYKYFILVLVVVVKMVGYGFFCYIVNDMVCVEEICQWGVDVFCIDCIDFIVVDVW